VGIKDTDLNSVVFLKSVVFKCKRRGSFH